VRSTNEQLKKLRDAVTGRGREVEVAADGSVREISDKDRPIDEQHAEAGKATKLAPRTFGA